MVISKGVRVLKRGQNGFSGTEALALSNASKKRGTPRRGKKNLRGETYRELLEGLKVV